MYQESEDRVYYRLNTHLEMLNDEARCRAYEKAVQSVVKDKIVLDVGCGTGILSLFAARAGARKVFAVDMDLPPGTEEIARINGLAERIQFFRGRLQDIELPVEKVDIIVSEWMGGLLLMEDMLPVVLYARDRWLKPDGILLPDRARLFIVPLDDVAGLSSKRFPVVRQTISSQMWVSVIEPSRFLAEPSLILDFDLYSLREADAREYEFGFKSFIIKDGTLNGFGLWFDVIFTRVYPPVVLSTAPWLPPTHWVQGLWILPQDLKVRKDDVVLGIFAQTEISPSNACFEVNLDVINNIPHIDEKKKTSIIQKIEANPSNMNTSENDDQTISQKAINGDYQGQECLWIGCSMSFGALLAARNGAQRINILNHSSWAKKAMQQLSAQEGLINVGFIHPKSLLEIKNKDIFLLGTADNSWSALLSHIKIRSALNRADFKVLFSWRESPWKEFYGFDFSSYTRYDLEMSHHIHSEFSPAPGLILEDTTTRLSSDDSFFPREEIIYQGIADSTKIDETNLTGEEFNCIHMDFNCGKVILPLPETISLDKKQKNKVQTITLTISTADSEVCRFRLELNGPDISISQTYNQPLTSMGHIVRN